MHQLPRILWPLLALSLAAIVALATRAINPWSLVLAACLGAIVGAGVASAAWFRRLCRSSTPRKWASPGYREPDPGNREDQWWWRGSSSMNPNDLDEWNFSGRDGHLYEHEGFMYVIARNRVTIIVTNPKIIYLPYGGHSISKRTADRISSVAEFLAERFLAKGNHDDIVDSIHTERHPSRTGPALRQG